MLLMVLFGVVVGIVIGVVVDVVVDVVVGVVVCWVLLLEYFGDDVVRVVVDDDVVDTESFWKEIPSHAVPAATLFDDKVLGDKTPFQGVKGLDSYNFI